MVENEKAQCFLKTKTCLFPSENRAHKPDDVAQLADLRRRAGERQTLPARMAAERHFTAEKTLDHHP
jgi:hypothetical protein